MNPKEIIDIDYWNKLSEEEKKYLAKFCSEFYYGFFNNEEYSKTTPNIHTNALHKTDCWKRSKGIKTDLFTKGLRVDSVDKELKKTLYKKRTK